MGEERVEQHLIELARRGDRSAFAELAPALGDRLYSVAHRILRDRDVAGDLTQQTLIKVWRELPSLRAAAQFDAWTYRLIVNACFDELRRRRRHPPPLTLVESDGVVPEIELSIADRDQLDRGFVRLSPEHRAVIILTYYLEYSAPDIATVLGVPVGTVRSRLHYAKRALRAALDADGRRSVGSGRWA